jgi:hypothetical protein
MFPKTNSQGDMPPTGDQTVMKQAAELLEEALRGAGGSMDEIGQNPLFDQVSAKTKDAESAATLAKLKEPSAPEKPAAHDAGPTADVDDLMRPIPELERAAAAERIRRSSSPPAISPNASTLASATRGPTPTPKASTRPPSAVEAVGDAPPKNRWILPVLLVAAAGGLGFFVYTQMHAVPASDGAVTPPPPTAASASATPSAQPSASAPVASASAEPVADSAIDAATDAASDAADAADGAKAAAPATARPAAPAAPPRPRKPAATPATDDDDDNTPPAPASTAAGTPTPGATAGTDTTPAAATATTPKPAPTKKPKSDDDNPY